MTRRLKVQTIQLSDPATQRYELEVELEEHEEYRNLVFDPKGRMVLVTEVGGVAPSAT